MIYQVFIYGLGILTGRSVHDEKTFAEFHLCNWMSFKN